MNRLIPIILAVALSACDQPANTTTEPAVDTAGAAQQPAAPAPELKSQVFQFGIYKAVKKGQIRESTETNTGKVMRKPTLEHEKMTDRIPLVKDTYFGFQYRLWNLPPEVMIKPVMPLRKVLIHPEMTLPDGSTTTGWDRTFKGRVQTQQVMGFDGYGFNEDYELVEGDWIFQVWYQDRKLIERKFVTYHPKAAQAAAATEKE